MLKRRYDLPLLILFGAIILFIFSKNSYLYTTNDWVDVNSFMTTGNGWVHGLIPYKDLFEQKGPILFWIYALAARTKLYFHGIFLLELITMSTTMVILYHTFQKILDQRLKINLTLIIFAIILTFDAYFTGGGGVEELGLPFIAYQLYLFTKVIKKETITTIQWIFAALGFNILFWIKYTLVLTYVILTLIYYGYLIYQNKIKILLQNIAINVIILISVAGIISLYFWHVHALTDLYQVYFYDNIFIYGANPMPHGHSFIYNWINRFKWILILFGLLTSPVIFKKKLLISKWWVFVFIGIILINFNLSNSFAYYSLIMVPLVIYLLYIGDLSKYWLILLIFMTSSLSIYTSYNIHETKWSNHLSSGQIVQKTIGDSNSVVQFGLLDTGYFNLTHTTPQAKYFHMNNIKPSAFPELLGEPLKVIQTKHIKYVITRKVVYDYEKENLKQYKIIKKFNIKSYAYSKHQHEGSSTYYILKLKQ